MLLPMHETAIRISYDSANWQLFTQSHRMCLLVYL